MAKSQQKKDMPHLAEHAPAALEEYEKGMRLFQQKDHQKAIARFQAVIEQHPGETDLCDRSRMYIRIASGEVTKRQPARTTRNPADSYAVGVYLLNAGDFKEAVRHLERACEHAPSDDGAYIALASAQLQAGDETAALGSLTKALTLNPRKRVEVRSLTDFAALESNPDFQALLSKTG